MIGMHHAFHGNFALLRGDPSNLLPGGLELIEHAPPIPLVRAAQGLSRCAKPMVRRACRRPPDPAR